MDTATFLGLIAALFTTVSLFPQAVKVVKTKNTKDISLAMYLIFSAGVVFWLIYGILINDLPIILANTITLVLALIILVHKLKYK